MPEIYITEDFTDNDLVVHCQRATVTATAIGHEVIFQRWGVEFLVYPHSNYIDILRLFQFSQDYKKYRMKK